MSAEQCLAELAHLSFADCFRKTVEHLPDGGTLERPGLLGFCSDLPISTLNGIIVTEPHAEPFFDEALEWIVERGRPYTVWIAEPLKASLGFRCIERGLARREWTTPGMALAPIPEAPPRAPGVTVLQVNDRMYEEHLATWAEAGLPKSVGRVLMSPAFLHDPEVRLFTGYLDGRPAGVAVALRSGPTSGIVGVGTLRAARRRGVGTAVTWAAAGAGREWGARAAILQSTEMGFPVYRAMGFETVVRYVEYSTDEGGP